MVAQPRLRRDESRTLLWVGTAFVALGVLLPAGLLYLLRLADGETRAHFEAATPLIIQHSLDAGMYGLVLAGPGFLVLGAMGVYAGVRGRRVPERAGRRMKQLAAVFLVGSLVGYVVARQAGNHQRAGRLHAAGYVQCPQSFLLTGKLFRQVWVRDAAVCTDPEFRRLMVTARRDEVIDFLRQREPATGAGRRAAQDGASAARR